MFQVITSWIGIYFLIGMLPLPFLAKNIWESWGKDDEVDHQAMAQCYAFMLAWPLLYPLVVYFSIMTRIYTRFKNKVNSQATSAVNLLKILVELKAVDEKTWYRVRHAWDDKRAKKLEDKRKKYRL